MIENFTLKLADRIIKTHTRYPYCMKQCRDYLTEGVCADIIAETTNEAIEEMRGEKEGLSCGYAEHLCIYRSIAEQFPFHNRMVFHGAVISFRGNGYLFDCAQRYGKDHPHQSLEEISGGGCGYHKWR